jgi:signal transduction histidine kinase
LQHACLWPAKDCANFIGHGFIFTTQHTQDYVMGHSRKRRIRFFKYLFPHSLAGRLMLAILIIMALSHVVSICIVRSERHELYSDLTKNKIIPRAISLVKTLVLFPEEDQRRILENLSSNDIYFSLDDAAILQNTPNSRYLFYLEGNLKAMGLTPKDEATRHPQIIFIDEEYINDMAARFGNCPPKPYRTPAAATTLGPCQDNISVRDVHEIWHTQKEKWHRNKKAIKSSMLPLPSHEETEEDDFFFDDDTHKHSHKKHPPLWENGVFLSIPLEHQKWLNMVVRSAGPPPSFNKDYFVLLIISSAITILVISSMVRSMTKPVSRLSDAADHIGRGIQVDDIPEKGPKDIRNLIRAFNEMNRRINKFVHDRTRLLAAVSHDLRTPLTSLRLRSEFIQDDDLRQKIQITLADMERITNTTLSFARESLQEEQFRRVNISALLESICDDHADLGQEVTCISHKKDIVLDVRSQALKRAIHNIITNALKYGNRADLCLDIHGKDLRITCTDTGPGIPENEMENVFEPFYRIDAARDTTQGGVGLGLAISRDILRAHGGDISLHNNIKNSRITGLTVRMIIPI